LGEEDLQEFLAYYRTSEVVAEQATREQLADAGRLLAVQVAYYMQQFGPIPEEVRAKSLAPVTEAERDRLTEAMEMFIKAVALAIANGSSAPTSH